MIENYRIAFNIRRFDGTLAPGGFHLVQYAQHPELWEPVDTEFARGAGTSTKRVTETREIGEGELSGTPLNGNVFYPRTSIVPA